MITQTSNHELTKHRDDLDTNLIKDFKHINLDSGNRSTVTSSHHTHNEGTAEQSNPARQKSSRSIDVFDYSPPENAHISDERQNHSEHIAERNVSSSIHHNHTKETASPIDHQSKEIQEPFSHEEVKTFDKNHQICPESVPSFQHGGENQHGFSSIKRKPVPVTTETGLDSDKTQSQVSQHSLRYGSVDGHAKTSQSAAEIDLPHRTDTTHHVHMAQAVTYETIQPVIHNIQSEKITREVHNVDIYHRILPIKDVEILPARHFIRSQSGELKEIPPPTLPVVSDAGQKIM
jgi:hypothetical protein